MQPVRSATGQSECAPGSLRIDAGGGDAVERSAASTVESFAGDPSAWAPLLRESLGGRNFEHWFHQRTTLRVDDCTLTVGVASPFLLSWMQRQFREPLARAARAALGPAAEIRFVVDTQVQLALAPSSSRAETPAGARAVIGSPGDGDISSRRAGERESPASAARNEPTLPLIVQPVAAGASSAGSTPAISDAPSRPSAHDGPRGGRRLSDLTDFVVGGCNRLPFLAASQVCEAPGSQHNPLYIHGNVGTGKSHLLEGICRRVRRAFASLQVVLLTAEAFANCFTEALRDRSLPAFRQRFRTVDVLLVDDVDFLDGKPMIEEEFLHTFKQLEARGRQIVVASDRHPRLLGRITPELATRFLAGLVCRLENPDPETRLEIVRRRAGRIEADLAPEALAFVAERFTGNVRELEGAVNCLAAWHAATGKRVTLTAARGVLADLERDCVRIVRLGDVERAVCQFFGLTADELKSPTRTRALSQPRMLAMYLARRMTPAAYQEIGQHFGGRNHSTVMAAEKRVQKWLDTSVTLRVASQSWPMGDLLGALEQRVRAG